MLELTAISKSFADVQVLDSLNLSVAPGSRTAIVGPSGSGKTTLLRILAGFETPDTGRIVMQGRTLFDENRFVPAHQRGIGFVPQEGALFPHLNVADNIAWGLDGTRHEKRQRVEALMEMVSLDRQLATHWPHEISGGQQQRVALARALAQRPSLMLLDEPFSALDTGLRAMTRKATADLLAEAGVASILVTHDQNEALSFATQVAVMRSGRFTQVGTPYEVYTRPVDEETALFLGDALILPAQLTAGYALCALGKVLTDNPLATGQGRVMLRPEQLSVTACASHESPISILDVDFTGHLSTLTLGLTGQPQPVTFKTVSQPGWNPGTAVRIDIAGTARVFGYS
ncbi:ABC transporter ATP-binding protein [Enterobacter roggenkampii]|uniref:ABC transporter ATP-binding protein n=1 Tax=Enterobacter roggenkampii TaxID=1812935 RepID=A0ABD7H202_9ENTR|nr:ABC transporter ATP-binding protein [Enterobacter roggenkampii]EHF8250618.1 ABC transporter ATP-binding protein [Enterobacter roggenkampii]MBA7741851.1 ABC transporter ATP-binding protein [Enterobacter roggenkampii]MBT2028099.1 ABC transporter ATP-binding protein [Enterobacter roggenkampii]MBT2032637.1 ABC transporter ATP-binding protein [Enterobacter roggenkampii]MCM7639772.1 ABC transporter ATP-binding protein [Enterobacter roggenkampii]